MTVLLRRSNRSEPSSFLKLLDVNISLNYLYFYFEEEYNLKIWWKGRRYQWITTEFILPWASCAFCTIDSEGVSYHYGWAVASWWADQLFNYATAHRPSDTRCYRTSIRWYIPLIRVSISSSAGLVSSRIGAFLTNCKSIPTKLNLEDACCPKASVIYFVVRKVPEVWSK